MSGFVDRPGRAFPEIRFGDQSGHSCYDGPTHRSRVVVSELPDGHQLTRSMDGTYISRRLIDDGLGESVCDEHGRREIRPHIGESERELIARWSHGVGLGWW